MTDCDRRSAFQPAPSDLEIDPGASDGSPAAEDEHHRGLPQRAAHPLEPTLTRGNIIGIAREKHPALRSPGRSNPGFEHERDRCFVVQVTDENAARRLAHDSMRANACVSVVILTARG